jgi:hypothetical protein
MDRLPSELVHSILQKACTDDGKTGCALSTVFHYIRTASSAMRYHSIALRGARQIRKFLALLELPAPSQNQKGRKGMKHKLFLRILDPTIHVRHLFIADCAEDRPGENPSWTEWQNDPDAGILSKFVRSVTGNSTRIKQWVVDSWTAGAIIRTLLNHVAPTLVHLCLDRSMLTDEVYVPVALPALVELTCCFRNPWHHGNNRFYPKQPHVQEQLPVLERLHIVLGQESPGLCWLNMPRVIPSSLSYVRFSNVSFPFHLLASLLLRSKFMGEPGNSYHRYFNTVASTTDGHGPPIVARVGFFQSEHIQEDTGVGS